VIGDATGALRIGGLVLKRVYDAFFRGGPTTEMTALVFDALKITHEDELVDAIVARVNTKQVKKDSLATIAFQAATGGDRVAIDILSSAGVESARSVIGAARKLDFSHETSIDVVMAGAVYVKGDNPTLVETFQYEVSRHVEQPVNFILLSVPPVVGAVIWAIESLRGTVPEGVRAQIVQSMSDEKEHR
jgi:N-acetylglucosamine kinase-like BadF-type ATPase